MNAGAQALLHGANGSFDLAHVTVSGDDVECDGQQLSANTVKFIVGVDVMDAETAGGVRFDNGTKTVENGGLTAVGGKGHGAVPDVAGNGVKKRDTLDVKKISA